LSFEWKIAVRGNSGLKYRVFKYGQQTLGLEYQICDEPEGRPLSRKSAGALYDLYEPAPERVLKPAGEWNSARIVVCGDRIEHWLNGAPVVTAIVGGEQWRRRIAESKFADKQEFGENRSRQRRGLSKFCISAADYGALNARPKRAAARTADRRVLPRNTTALQGTAFLPRTRTSCGNGDRLADRRSISLQGGVSIELIEKRLSVAQYLAHWGSSRF
jgi:hypothetical protein